MSSDDKVQKIGEGIRAEYKSTTGILRNTPQLRPVGLREPSKNADHDEVGQIVSELGEPAKGNIHKNGNHEGSTSQQGAKIENHRVKAHAF
jgi:hypothetical protein